MTFHGSTNKVGNTVGAGQAECGAKLRQRRASPVSVQSIIGDPGNVVNMAWHPAIGENDPSAPLDLVFKPFCEAFTMPRVVEQLSATIKYRPPQPATVDESGKQWAIALVTTPC